jgi:hypothetical protein
VLVFSAVFVSGVPSPCCSCSRAAHESLHDNEQRCPKVRFSSRLHLACLLPFLQRAPTAVGVPGFQAGGAVGVTRAVLHFYFRDLSNRENKNANQFLPSTCKVKRRRMRHFKVRAMGVPAAVARQAIRHLFLWSSGQVDCRVGGINTTHCSQNCPFFREEMLAGSNKKTNK